MTETALFHAYRNMTGYSTECSCGDVIESRFGTEDAIREALRIHYESTVHQQWTEWQEAVHALRRPARRPCPCHNHGAA
jgi:hypothetical protein